MTLRLAQLRTDVVDVRRDLATARELDSTMWVLTKDGAFRQCRLVPAQAYTDAMGPVLENRIVDGNTYRLVWDR